MRHQASHHPPSPDWEVKRSRAALVTLGISALIPIAFTIDDLIFGQQGWFWTYALWFFLLLAEGIFVYRNRATGRWRPLVIATLLVGVPLAVLSPVSRFIEVMIFLGCIPFLFQIGGLSGGVRWSLVVVSEFVLLAAAAAVGLVPPWMDKYPWALLPVLVATFVVIAALVWSLAWMIERSQEDRLQSAHYDPLTGWPRRPLLIEELSDARSPGARLALVRWDNHGELMRLLGPEDLTTLMNALRNRVGQMADTRVYHLRDQDFALLLGPRAPAAMDIHEGIEGLDLRAGNWPFRLLVTLGTTDKLPGCDREALSRADKALGAALDAKLPWFHADTTDEPVDQAKLWIERHAQLCRNLELGLCQVVFQPVFDSHTREPRWYEALARIEGAGGQLESVWHYLPVAEASGLLPRITRAVLAQAAAFADAHGVAVSINLTLQDLRDEGLLGELLETAASRRPGLFILELLERDHFSDVNAVSRFISRAVASGCRVALDDFGSGYSNFGTLSAVDLSLVKIDGELARRASSDLKALALIRALVQFCRETGLEVVAEHVDSEVLATLFRDMGVDYLQGFYLGKPESTLLAR